VNVRTLVRGFVAALPLAACGSQPAAERTPTAPTTAATAPATAAAVSLAPSTVPPPETPAPRPSSSPRAQRPADPVPDTLTSVGEACTRDRDCALLFTQQGCCSCGSVVPLTVRALEERARESLPRERCELIDCRTPECRGPGIEGYRPVCINHSCGAVRR
jgi:hypothetical protein